MFKKHPKTNKDFFIKAPKWMFKEIISECEKLGFETREKKDVPGHNG
jgi:hypothetical protein